MSEVTRKPRPARSKIAQPLIMALGGLTLVASGSYVTMAATATGSVRPGDWSRLDWTAVADHYQLCVQQDGAGAMGCLLTASARPAAAAEAAAPPAPAAQPFYTVVVIPDATPTPRPRPAVPRAAPSPSPRATTPASTVHPSPSPTPPHGGDD